MPRNKRQSRQSLVEQEGRIELAIKALKNNEISNIARAAATFSIPESTLRGRVKGQRSQAELRNHAHRLTEHQEEALVK
jgi:hypothetical protein